MPPRRGSSPPTYNDQDNTDHHAVLDASLRSQRKTENAPTNRIKHLMLSKRQEVYKGLMADISQVCDGRSVETMRGSSDQSSRMVEVDTLLLPFRRSFSDEGDLVKKVIKKSAAVAVGGGPSRINSSWHGGRASLLRDLEQTPAQEQKAPCHSKHKKSEETPTKEQEAPHHSLINNVLRTAESLLQDLEGETIAQEQKAPRQALRSTDDLLNKYRPVRDTKSERKTRNRASYQKSRRPSVESSEGSMSSLTSLNSGGSHDVIPRRRRRASDATSTTSSTAELSRSDPSLLQNAGAAKSQSKVTLRKKYKPRHRCPSTNGSVTGIVKPSRYTQGNAGQATACERRYSTTASTNANSITDSPGSSTSINRTFNRRNSAPDSFKPTFSRRNSAPQSFRMSAQLDPYKIMEEVSTRFDESADDGIEGTPSDEMKDTSAHSLSLSTHSNDNWVPTGVDFSASMEVYLFEK